MLGPADETVGIYFDLQLLEAARDKALQVIQAAALAARQIALPADAAARASTVPLNHEPQLPAAGKRPPTPRL